MVGQMRALAKGGRDRDVGHDTQRGEVQLHEVGCGPAAGGWTEATGASTWIGATASAVHAGSMAGQCTHSVRTLSSAASATPNDGAARNALTVA